MKRAVFWVLFIFECLIAAGVVIYVYLRIAGRSRPFVIPIPKDSIEIPIGSGLSHYYAYRPNQRILYSAPWLSGEIAHTTNADGLADRYNYVVPSPHGVFRVLAIGDSFTQGVLVKTEESYPEVLEDMFVKTLPEGKRVEVLNLGVGGYDVEYAAYRLQHQGMKYEPDVVVWLLKFDDFFLINEKNSGVRGSMQDELEKVNIPVTKEFTDFNYWSNHIRERYVREFGVASELSYQASKFLRTRTFYRGPIVILYYPDDDPMFIDMLKAFEKRDKGVVLTALPTDMSRFPDGHPDPQGHIAIAQAAWEPVSSLLYAEATPSGGRRYAP